MSTETSWAQNDRLAVATACNEGRGHTVKLEAAPDFCCFMTIVNPHGNLRVSSDEFLTFGAIMSADDALALGQFLVRYYGDKALLAIDTHDDEGNPVACVGTAAELESEPYRRMMSTRASSATRPASDSERQAWMERDHSLQADVLPAGKATWAMFVGQEALPDGFGAVQAPDVVTVWKGQKQNG